MVLSYPPSLWIPRVKQLGSEADHLPGNSAEVMTLHDFMHPSHTFVFMAQCLIKDRDDYTSLMHL